MPRFARNDSAWPTLAVFRAVTLNSEMVGRDGSEYRFCRDKLAARVFAQMLAAGVEVVDPDTWENTLHEIYKSLETRQYEVG